MYQHGWQREKQHWSRRNLRKEMLPSTIALLHTYYLCGSCWLVSWRKKYMHIYLGGMCYRISRKDAGKTHEEWRTNSWLTTRFWSTVRRTTIISQHDRLITKRSMIWCMWESQISIVNLFENSKETWRTEVIACNESLGEVDIRRGIFQGDSFSLLLFVVVLIPLSIFIPLLLSWMRQTLDR